MSNSNIPDQLAQKFRTLSIVSVMYEEKLEVAEIQEAFEESPEAFMKLMEKAGIPDESYLGMLCSLDIA